MRGVTLVLCLVVTNAAAQQSTPVPPDSAPPTPEQLRYLDGLRTAGRGIAQIKHAITSVANAAGDSVRLERAAFRLGGLCGAGRRFMTSGRRRMRPGAYQDSTEIQARRLALRVDSLIHAAAGCQRTARTQPDSTAAVLLREVRSYEAVLRDFRTAIGLPNH
jgi:hypothetical protein